MASVTFSPDGYTLASGSVDATTRLWNLDVQQAINRICGVADGLTPRQWDLLQLIAGGRTNVQIARQLGLPVVWSDARRRGQPTSAS